jgi:hypothetical protein
MERTMRKVFFAATAMAAALMGAQPAAAQQYGSYHDEHVSNQYQCQQSRNNRTAGGAVIGAVLGAVVGHNAAGRRANRDEGTALGAVVGAVAGGAIGRNTARCDDVPQGAYDPYNGQAYGQYPDDGYYRDDDRYRDDRYRDGRYSDSRYGRYEDGYGRGRECREEQVVRRDRRGRRYVQDVWLCRGRDGVWREG